MSERTNIVFSLALVVACAPAGEGGNDTPTGPAAPTCTASATSVATTVVGEARSAEVRCEDPGGVLDSASVRATGAFELVSGSEGVYSLLFRPDQEGTASGGLVIDWSDGSLEVTLSGTGVNGSAYSPVAVTSSCAAGAANPWEDALGRLSVTDSDWRRGIELHGEAHFKATHQSPGLLACVSDQLGASWDALDASATPLTEALRQAASFQGATLRERSRLHPDALPGTAADAFSALCALYASDGCDLSAADSDALAPVTPLLWALVHAHEAALGRDQGVRSASHWHQDGGNGLMFDPLVGGYDRGLADDRAYLATGHYPLYDAAAEIVREVEAADREAWQSTLQPGAWSTPAGWVRILGPGEDRVSDDEAVLLLIDLGGNDSHLGRAGGNASAENAVSVLIDLGGDDLYAYPEAEAYAGDGSDLPADADGRYEGDSNYGTVSMSKISRQGGARNGIALSFDFGSGNDRYFSLRGSQGYAHHGVGILYDEAGNDRYLAEMGSQGTAQFGIGILWDKAGDDEHYAVHAAQGHGFAHGMGILVNLTGDDRYECAAGAEGNIMYDSAQLSGRANASLCQGFGFGFRDDDAPDKALAGGIGVLRDAAGNDQYEAGVFAQGAGYWEGLGVLADGAGDDQYDARWYGQGAAAHHASGLMLDQGTGADRFNVNTPAQSMVLGAGQHLSVAAFVDEGGNDQYEIPNVAAGAGVSGGAGLLLELGGNDAFRGTHFDALAIAKASELLSLGLMLDNGGTDSYDFPSGASTGPSDGGTWGHGVLDTAFEEALGLDYNGAN